MPASKKIAGPTAPNSQTRADLTQSNAALAAKVLADPSIFPDTFTAWIPRWIMQNVNFKVVAAQLPTVEAPKVVGASGQPAFQNSWVASTAPATTPAFYKDAFGRVFVMGQVKNGTVNSGATGDIFTLPAGYRPQFKSFFAVASNGALGVCTIDVTGEVRAEVGSNVYFSLDGISFRQYS